MSGKGSRARLPVSGKIVGADGEVHNIVDLLGGGTPVCAEAFDISTYTPASGLMIGSDGKLYDLVHLLSNRGGGSGGPIAASTVTYGNGSNVAAALDALATALGNVSAALDAILGEVVE